jgi:hypothetical protein
MLLGRDRWGRIWVDISDPCSHPDLVNWLWVDIDAPLIRGLAELTASGASRTELVSLFFQRLAEKGGDPELRELYETRDPAAFWDCVR